MEKVRQNKKLTELQAHELQEVTSSSSKRRKRRGKDMQQCRLFETCAYTIKINTRIKSKNRNIRK